MATGRSSSTLWGPGEQDFPPPSPEPQEIVVPFTTPGGYIWTVPSNIARGRADILIVGGGGGANRGLAGQYVAPGGGGAGRFILLEDFPLVAGDEIEIVVGAGGLGVRDNADIATPGEASSFGAIIAPGGGTGGLSTGTRAAIDGGSGGGSDFFGNPSLAIPGAGVAGLGHNGAGTPTNVNGNRSGGGGGAGGPGSLGYSNRGGDGGPGIYVQWADAHGYGDNGWFAGGGAGGVYNNMQGGPIPAGGRGGGGNGGGPGQDGQDGMPGTGGGGGGAGTAIVAVINSKGGDGGSGIVLIRYYELV